MEPASPPPPACADEELVLQAVGGSEEAFRVLYRRHSPRLRGLIRRLLGCVADESDDVLQVVWLRAMLGAATFKRQSALSTWLCGIAVRATMESLRQARRHRAFSLEANAYAPVVDIASRMDISNAMSRLPDHYRVAIVLHDVEGFTHDEIAEQLAIPIGTSKSNLHRARRAMRVLLTPRNEGPTT